jgi:ABC-type transport system substrate-binding protein
MKTRVTILIVTLIALLAMSPAPHALVRASTTYGPRIDELLIKIYGSALAEFAAFEACEIDLVDTPLGSAEVGRWSTAPYNEIIVLDQFTGDGMFQFDINNNYSMLSYPESVYGRSPTSYPEFRHAIAHMVDKPTIISTIVGGYGIQLEAPVKPWLRWYDPTMPTHNYDPAEACSILQVAGWRNSADPNVAEDVHFPPGHKRAGELLRNVLTRTPSDPGLIFFRRSDDMARSMAGQLLIYGSPPILGLESIGMPVEDLNVPRATCSPNVMYKKDFHIYTGSWNFGRDPYYLWELWHSSRMNWDITEFAWNYDNINDALWDTYVENVKYAKTINDAEYWCYQACQRFGSQVFFIPLWTTNGYLAHKKPWHINLLNSVDSNDVLESGPRMFWPLITANDPTIGITGGQLRLGFQKDVEMLNVIYSEWRWDWYILDLIFDTLIRENPWNHQIDMPWMANDWTCTTWTNPDTGEIASKVSFTLIDGIKWINPITGTVNSAVTPEDVRFSFQYVYDKVGWNYPSVADLYKNPDGSLKIEISGNTITFYESKLSVWAYRQLGSLPIIPRSVYQNIVDPHGFTPGSTGIDLKTLMGCGPFYFVSYAPGVSVYMKANRNYFKPIFPNIDTDPTYIKLDWGIFRANVKAMDWTVNVLDMIIVASALGWEGPVGGIPADVRKDGEVNVLDLIVIATNLEASWDP